MRRVHRPRRAHSSSFAEAYSWSTKLFPSRPQPWIFFHRLLDTFRRVDVVATREHAPLSTRRWFVIEACHGGVSASHARSTRRKHATCEGEKARGGIHSWTEPLKRHRDSNTCSRIGIFFRARRVLSSTVSLLDAREDAWQCGDFEVWTRYNRYLLKN